jgi:hypothetical protein
MLGLACTQFATTFHRAFASCTARRLLFIALGSAASAAGAQPEELRWGRIPAEDLAMTAYAADTTAGAVVLADVGRTTFELADRGFRIAFRRHRRVKVLSEAGYDAGTVVVRFDTENSERLFDVRGQTFVPTPGGEPRRVELARGDIFTTDVGEGLRETRFTLPALAPGVVFEFSYEFTSPNIVLLPRWYFQDRVPTRYSALEVELPRHFGYAAVTEGAHRIEQGEAAARTNDLGQGRRFWWIGRNVPALVEEPYVAHLPDHLQQMQLQLQTVLDPSFGFTENFLHTWESLATALDEHPGFGGRLAGGRRIRDEAERLAAGADGPERLRLAYDAIRNSVTWDGRFRVFPDRDLDDVLSRGQGSSGEVNLVLLAMLRRMGLAATPVLLSTRTHGRAFPDYPLLSQFNHLVVLAEPQGGQPTLLDATSAVLPAGLLPVESLSGSGWRVDRANPTWITFQPLDRTGTTAHLTGRITPEGDVVGRVTARLTGYDAGEARAYLRENGPGGGRDALMEAISPAHGASLDSVVANAVDDVYEPLEMEATLLHPHAAELIGDRLYLAPILLMRHTESPFRLPQRSYPVEFGHPFTETYTAELDVPDGYEVESLPEPVTTGMPVPTRTTPAIRYARSVTANGRTIVIQMRLEVMAPTLPPAGYQRLRALFDTVVAAEAETIVLRPVQGGTGAASPDPGPGTGE